MNRKVRYTHFFFPMLVGLVLVLVTASLVYGFYIHCYTDTLPRILTFGLLPLLVALTIGYFLIPRIRQLIVFKWLSAKTNVLVLYLIFITISMATFVPLANSLRYNIGQVQYLGNIDEMPAHAQSTFLELGEWHTDRMRVMPVNTYERGKWWNRHHVQLKSMYLVPIFSEETAYRTHAKAWLAFKYTATIPYEEFTKNQGKPYYDKFVNHFKRINVTAFRYFERYPRGKEHQLFTNMARVHSYFRSGYTGVYEGHTMDRDLVSIRYFAYFLVVFFLFVVPTMWLISRFLLRPLQVPAN